MDRTNRKRIIDELSAKNLAEFRKQLPIPEIFFPKLFDFIDQKMSTGSCQNNFHFTKEFCFENIIESEKLISWLQAQSVGCDCEILNLEDRFEYLNKQTKVVQQNIQIHKKKINFLQTDFGYNIDNIPCPWLLIEEIIDGNTSHTFQIGKSTSCLVKIERNFPIKELYTDQFWIDAWTIETELDYNLDDMTIERQDYQAYTMLSVKSKNWIPVVTWCKNINSNLWFLKMKTELSRYKGDYKECLKLLDSIKNIDK